MARKQNWRIETEPVPLEPRDGYRRLGLGWITVSVGARSYTFHPLEWDPKAKLEDDNPFRFTRIDRNRRRQAIRLRARLEAYMKEINT